DELVLVAHLAQRGVEARDVFVAQVRSPVEGGRAVVGEKLAGELLVNRLGKLARLLEVGFRRLEPEQVRIGRVGKTASNGRLEPAFDTEVAFGRIPARPENTGTLVAD